MKFTILLFIFAHLYLKIFGESLKDASSTRNSQKQQCSKVNVILFMATTMLEKKENTFSIANWLERSGFILAAKVKVEMNSENANAACQSRLQCSKNSLLQWAKTFKNMTTVTLSLIKEEEDIFCSPGKHENRKLYEYQVDFQNKRNLVVSPLVRGKIIVSSSVQNDKTYGNNDFVRSSKTKNYPNEFLNRIEKPSHVVPQHNSEENEDINKVERMLHPKSDEKHVNKGRGYFKYPHQIASYSNKDEHKQISRPSNNVEKHENHHRLNNNFDENDLPHLFLKPLHFQTSPMNLGKYKFHSVNLRPINSNQKHLQLNQKPDVFLSNLDDYNKKTYIHRTLPLDDKNHYHSTKNSNDNSKYYNNPDEQIYLNIKPKSGNVDGQQFTNGGVIKMEEKPKQNIDNLLHYKPFGSQHDSNGVGAQKSINLVIDDNSDKDGTLENQNRNYQILENPRTLKKSGKLRFGSSKNGINSLVSPLHFHNLFNVLTSSATEKHDIKMNYPHQSTSSEEITILKGSKTNPSNGASNKEIISDSERFDQNFPFTGLANVHRTKRGISIDDETEEVFTNPKSIERKPDEETSDAVTDSSTRNSWNFLGMMSAFKNSFFNDMFYTLNGKTRSTEEDDLDTKDIGKIIEEPSLAALLLQIIQDAELQSYLTGQSGYLIVVDGLNINDLHDCKSDLSRGIMAARKSTKKSQTLIVVMGSCPTKDIARKQILNERNTNKHLKDIQSFHEDVSHEHNKEKILLDRRTSTQHVPSLKMKHPQTYHDHVVKQEDEKDEEAFSRYNDKKNLHNTKGAQKNNLNEQVQKTHHVESLDEQENLNNNPAKLQQHSNVIRNDDQCKTSHRFIPVYASGPGQKHFGNAKCLESVPFLIRDVVMTNGRASRDTGRARSINSDGLENGAKFQSVRSFLSSATTVYLHTAFIIVSVLILAV